MRKIKIVAVVLFVLFASNKLIAQPNPGPGNQNSTIQVTNDGPTVPFDGGMSLMLAASGIGYVSKKLKRK